VLPRTDSSKSRHRANVSPPAPVTESSASKTTRPGGRRPKPRWLPAGCPGRYSRERLPTTTSRSSRAARWCAATTRARARKRLSNPACTYPLCVVRFVRGWPCVVARIRRRSRVPASGDCRAPGADSQHRSQAHRCSTVESNKPPAATALNQCVVGDLREDAFRLSARQEDRDQHHQRAGEREAETDRRHVRETMSSGASSATSGRWAARADSLRSLDK
jgi:hypothetical protein